MFGTALWGAFNLLTAETKDEREQRERATATRYTSLDYVTAQNALMMAKLRQGEVGSRGGEAEGTRG
jgi:hypothetical protein